MADWHLAVRAPDGRSTTVVADTFAEAVERAQSGFALVRLVPWPSEMSYASDAGVPADHLALSDQQLALIALLDTARDDLLAGRPAQRTAYALATALRATAYTDMDDGTADDQAWRAARGAR